eukprot:484846-Prorocentrum_minimum.AAC.3
MLRERYKSVTRALRERYESVTIVLRESSLLLILLPVLYGRHLYDAPTGTPVAEEVPMTEAGGVWRVEGPASWRGAYYQYEVIVYSPATNQVKRGNP